jgi:carbonic anhydrase
MISPTEALQRLRDGNRRFVAGEFGNSESISQARRAELVGGQNPFAAIVACSDSRVPVELLFDQGLGDLFVVRVAGNVVAPSQIGSVEFAAANLGTRLVVVLGHSNCGAVDAALKSLKNAASNASPHLQTIIDGIRPALEPLVSAQDQVTLREAVAANVHQSVAQLREESDVLKELNRSGDIMIVGAKYSIETGEVRFFDD